MLASSSRVVRDWARCRKGSNAVEFALILPVFLLILFGLATFGIYLGAAHGVAQLAADGARAGLGGLDADERRRLSLAWIRAAARSYPLLDAERVAVTTREDGPAFEVVVRYDIGALAGLGAGLGVPVLGATIERSATALVSSGNGGRS